MQRSIKIYDIKHSHLIQEKIFELGYSWFNKGNNLRDYINLYFNIWNDREITYDYKPKFNLITTDELLSMKPELSYEVDLNDEYKAIIKNKIVKVGCQTFSFNSIERLYTAIETYKTEYKT